MPHPHFIEVNLLLRRPLHTPTRQSPGLRPMFTRASQPPFGLASLQPSFDRTTRVAKALFNAFDASVVLIEGDAIWRSRDRSVYSRANYLRILEHYAAS